MTERLDSMVEFRYRNMLGDAEQLRQLFKCKVATVDDIATALSGVSNLAKSLVDHIEHLDAQVKTTGCLPHDWWGDRERATVPCGVYGCTAPKTVGMFACDNCTADMQQDPDAYK